MKKAVLKGSINFGLVNIPVEMFSASQAQEIKFTMLHKKDLSEIRYSRICKAEGKEVPWKDIVKGYANEKGKYIVLTEEELKRASAEKSKSIEIVEFVKEEEIDSIYYEKPYVLEPQKGANKPYHLLLEVLKKSKKVGIAKYVIHNREHVGVLKFHGDFLIINQLRFESELKDFADLKAPAIAKVTTKEVDIAMQLINQMTAKFKPKDFKDNYVEEIKGLIKQKQKGKKIEVPKGEKKRPQGKVHDIMSLLKASLAKEKKPKRKSA